MDNRWSRFWRKFLSFPPYVVIKLSHPWSFPEDHKWKHRKITFDWWWRGATQWTLEYGAGLWTCIICISVLLARIYLTRGS